MWNLNHLNVSLLKSALRIAAGCYLMFGSFVTCGILLIIAEGLGILEELV